MKLSQNIKFESLNKICAQIWHKTPQEEKE